MNATRIIGTAISTALLWITAAGAALARPVEGIPGWQPATEIPGELRWNGGPAEAGTAESAGELVAQAGVPVGWLLGAVVVTALIAGAAGYLLRARRTAIHRPAFG